MNRHNKSLLHFKLLFIILFSLFFFVSCSKSEIDSKTKIQDSETKPIKSENVCTLTPEQVPDVRGFRIGMSFEQIEKRYPHLLKPLDPDSKIVGASFFFRSEFPSDELGKTQKMLWGDPKDINKFSELKGILLLALLLDNEIVEGFGIIYEGQSDKEFYKLFNQKMIDSLGISSFTNAEETLTKAPIQEMLTRKLYLLCNKVEISISTQDSLNESKDSVLPKLVIKKVNESAQTQTQIKSETFKP